eukprot:351133-Chlamydomonas_euryale.AAC.1
MLIINPPPVPCPVPRSSTPAPGPSSSTPRTPSMSISLSLKLSIDVPLDACWSYSLAAFLRSAADASKSARRPACTAPTSHQ